MGIPRGEYTAKPHAKVSTWTGSFVPHSAPYYESYEISYTLIFPLILKSA